MLVDEIADRLDPGPARLDLAEQAPRRAAELVDIAIAAAEEIHEVFRRHVFERHGLGVGRDRLKRPVAFEDGIARDLGHAGRGHEAGHRVAVAIAEALDIEMRCRLERTERPDTGRMIGMRVEQREDENRRGAEEFDRVAVADEHGRTIRGSPALVGYGTVRAWRDGPMRWGSEMTVQEIADSAAFVAADIMAALAVGTMAADAMRAGAAGIGARRESHAQETGREKDRELFHEITFRDQEGAGQCFSRSV